MTNPSTYRMRFSSLVLLHVPAAGEFRALADFRRQRARIHIVDAAHIDSDQVRAGARLVMGVDAAMLAEIMLRDARVPLIQGKRLLTLGEPEFVRRRAIHDRILALAQRAIALKPRRELAFDFEFHCTA